MPLYGAYRSWISKIAAETDNPQTNKALVTVALIGAWRPKLMKIMVSQKTRITSIGFEIELALCENISQRVSPSIVLRRQRLNIVIEMLSEGWRRAHSGRL